MFFEALGITFGYFWREFVPFAAFSGVFWLGYWLFRRGMKRAGDEAVWKDWKFWLRYGAPGTALMIGALFIAVTEFPHYSIR